MYVPIFDHADFAVFDKPAGVSVHSESGPGFVATLARQLPHTPWHLVHRLDKATSGLLILAKCPAAAAGFGAMFGQHAVCKYYLAIARGVPSKKQGLICGDMERTRNGQWKLCRSQRNPAITQFFSSGLGAGRRLFLLRPHTGRTHQLRVALKSLGTPILGDERYAAAEDRADRMYLHAYALDFEWAGERVQMVLPPAHGEHFAGIGSVLDDMGWSQPWALPWPRLPTAVVNPIMRPPDSLPSDGGQA